MDKKDDLFRQFGIASIMARSYDRKSLPRDKYGFEPVKDFFFASDQEDESSDSDSPSPPPVIKSHQSKVNGLDKSKPNTPLTRSMSSMIKSPLNDSSNTTVVRSKSSTPLIASKATAKSSSINNLSCVQPSSTVVKSKSSTVPITRSQHRATNDQPEVAIRAKLFDTLSSMSDSYLTNNKSLPPASPVMKSKSKIDKSKVSQSRPQSKVISTSTSSTVTISQSVTTKRRKKRKRITMPIKNNKVSKSKTSSEEQIKEKDYEDGFDNDKDEEEEERFVAESEEEKELDAEKDEERFDNGEEEDVSDSDYDDDSRYDCIPIQRKKKFTPNVRRTRRPHINTLGCGDYIEYVDHWGDTPSNQIGREAKYIIQRKNKEEVRRHRSKGNVVINEQEEYFNDIKCLYPGHKSKVIETDDIKIFRTISTSSIQKGRIEIKSYAEKPLARNDDNKEMIFEVISGKCIITIENVKFDLRANDTFVVPPGCVYYIVNNQKSKLTLIYTIIGV